MARHRPAHPPKNGNGWLTHAAAMRVPRPHAGPRRPARPARHALEGTFELAKDLAEEVEGVARRASAEEGVAAHTRT